MQSCQQLVLHATLQPIFMTALTHVYEQEQFAYIYPEYSHISGWLYRGLYSVSHPKYAVEKTGVGRSQECKLIMVSKITRRETWVNISFASHVTK